VGAIAQCSFDRDWILVELVQYCAPVLAGQRQQLIVDEVRRRGAVRVAELTELLGVSDMTVRRDLDVLAAAGLVEKVHGGATAPGRPSTHEPGFEAKSHRQLAEKQAIARAAVRLVEPGRAIGLTAGTTTWRLAHHLLDVPDLTVVTNSVRVAEVLDREPRPDRTVVLTGGVRTPSDALVGPVAVSTLQALHVDVLFLGVHGMADGAGFTTPNLLEAETNQAFVAAAERVVVVADHTKWGVRGLSRIARLDDADVLVTDAGLAADARAVLEEHVGRLIVAPVRVAARARGGRR
jgi:DeoR/GlpR family transcriptional regulator of sugar metabolism